MHRWTTPLIQVRAGLNVCRGILNQGYFRGVNNWLKSYGHPVLCPLALAFQRWAPQLRKQISHNQLRQAHGLNCASMNQLESRRGLWSLLHLQPLRTAEPPWCGLVFVAELRKEEEK